MDIKISNKIYSIPGACPRETPDLDFLRSQLAEHGSEAFVLSKSLGPYTACMLFELIEEGAVVIVDDKQSISNSVVPLVE